MSAPHQSRLFNWLVRRWVCTFLLMGVGFVVFGVLSLNLVQVFAANVRFLGEHGWDAIKEGGARQLLELIASVFGAIAFYLVFKTCEHALVERIAHYKTEKSSN